jgi:hypothetical protein
MSLPAESLDRLVELHVLSESGDPVAAADAASWLADDAEARQVWDTVEHTCRALRADAPTDTAG